MLTQRGDVLIKDLVKAALPYADLLSRPGFTRVDVPVRDEESGHVFRLEFYQILDQWIFISISESSLK